MKRREFSIHLAGGCLGVATLAGGPHTAVAQGNPMDGKHYVRFSQRIPVVAPAGKIAVLGFFRYGDANCRAFEPMLDGWRRKLPPDVMFRRVPVQLSHLDQTHAKLFHAIEAMGKVDELHRKVFDAIHVQGLRLKDEPEITSFMNSIGVDGAKFTEAFNSYATTNNVKLDKELFERHELSGLPSIGVNGRYVTGAPLAESNERTLEIADYLIQSSRKSR